MRGARISRISCRKFHAAFGVSCAYLIAFAFAFYDAGATLVLFEWQADGLVVCVELEEGHGFRLLGFVCAMRHVSRVNEPLRLFTASW